MGKGKRTRANTDLELKLKEEKAAAEKLNKKKSRIKSTIAVLIIVAVFAVSIGGSILINHLNKTGYFLRHSNAVSTQNYKVTSAMVQYLFNSTINNFADSNATYLSELGLNTTTNLKDQVCYYDKEISWHDYFMNNVKSQYEEIIIMAEEAHKSGMKLTESDKKYIEDSIKMFDTLAQEEGLTTRQYIDKYYGTQVNLDDIRACLELTQLASNYKISLEDSFTYSDTKIESYFEENKSTFLTCDYYSVYISNNATGSESDAELKSLNSEAKKIAVKIAKANSTTDFKNNITDYFTEVLKASDQNVTDQEIKEQVDSLWENSFIEGEGYDVSTDAGEWLFAEGRKIGDTAVLEAEEGGYNVYCLATPAKKDVSETKNVRHILLQTEDFENDAACEKEAKRLIKEWRNGEKTEKSFGELAKQYSKDPGSAQNGGLYENVVAGTMVEAFDTWIFAKSRKTGDVDAIKTDYGWHVMYFVSDGYVSWKADIVSALIADDYSKTLSTLKEKYSLKFNDKNFNKAKHIIREPEEVSSEAQTSELTY